MENQNVQCGLFLYTVEIYVDVISLIKKLTGQQQDRIWLGRGTRLKRLERRKESEESPVRH